MKNSSLLCLALLVFTASPLAGAWSTVSCGSDGSYAANSTYEANLRRLATVLSAEVSASPGRYVDRAIGYWPNRVRAVTTCGSGDGDCAACIADAFKRLEIECPFRKEANFFSRNCSLGIDEAIGLVCLFVKFLQTWRHDTTKRTIECDTAPPSVK